MISLVLASRLLFGSLPPGLQDNQDADLTNQLFNDAETTYFNLNDNSTSILPVHNQQFDQPTFFLPSKDVEDFFNKCNQPTEYQIPVQETSENNDFGFQTYTNNNNDISTLQNNIQFDPSIDFDLNFLASPETSQLQDYGSTFPGYTEFEGIKTESLSEIVQSGGIVPSAPVQATFNPSNNSLSFATKFPTVKSNSSRCKKYREEKKNKKIAAEEELKELELKNYTLKAKLKEKEEKVRKIREMTKSFFDPRSSKKLSIDAILLEFV